MASELVLLLWRKPAVLIVPLLLPLFYPLVISYLYQAALVRSRPALLVDRDNSALSRKLAMDLDATQGIDIIGRATSVEAAMAAIRRQQAELLLFVPRGFARQVKRGERAQLKLWINSGNMLTYSKSYAAVNAVISHFNAQIGAAYLVSQGLSTDRARRSVSPVRFQTHKLYHPTVSYGAFLVPGILLIVVQQIVLLALAYSIGLGRERGIVTPSSRLPFTNLEARALALVPLFALGAAFIIFIVFPLFGWPMTRPGTGFVLSLCFVVALLPWAILFAHFARDRYVAFQLLMFLSVPLFMMSGYAWPLDQMPAYIQVIAALLPSTPALQAWRLVVFKGSGLAAISPYLWWLMAQFVGYLVLTVVIVRFRAATPDPVS
jgi:ABC-2 type transport system permease protein